MVNETQNKPIEEIQLLKQLLSEKKQDELAKILQYGNGIKERGEMKNKEFWVNHNRVAFEKLLKYKWRNKEKIEKQYKYLDTIKGLEREKFIEEYLYDDMLYDDMEYKILSAENIERKTYSYNNWKEGNVVMEEGVKLNFSDEDLGSEGVKAIAQKIKLMEGTELYLRNNGIKGEGATALAKMELKEGVILYLYENKIGDEGAKAIAKKMKLKDCVELNLGYNEIGTEGAKAIAKMELKDGVKLSLGLNKLGADGAKAIAEMELKEGVELYLYSNKIGDEGAEAIAKKMKLKRGVKLSLQQNGISDEGAEAIIKNMELKEGVTIDLRYNHISEDMKGELKKREKSYRDRGINCEVLV